MKVSSCQFNLPFSCYSICSMKIKRKKKKFSNDTSSYTNNEATHKHSLHPKLNKKYFQTLGTLNYYVHEDAKKRLIQLTRAG